MWFRVFCIELLNGKGDWWKLELRLKLKLEIVELLLEVEWFRGERNWEEVVISIKDIKGLVFNVVEGRMVGGWVWVFNCIVYLFILFGYRIILISFF